MSLEFMKAVSSGKVDEVKIFLEKQGVDINYLHKNDSINTPVSALHVAVAKNHTEIIKLLVEKKTFNKDAVTDSNRSALHLAAGAGQLEICKLLLARVNTAIKDKNGNTAYDLAKSFTNAVDLNKRKKYQEIVELLKVPTFVEACRDNDLALVKKMVEEEHVDINGDFFGATGLGVACYRANYQIFEYLLSLRQINVNKKDGDGISPLHSVVHPGIKDLKIDNPQTDVLKRRQMAGLLVAHHGADVNARTKTYGATPLLHAVLTDNFLVVDLLVKSGADLNFTYPRNPEDQVWTADILDFAENHGEKIYNYLNEAKKAKREFDVAKKLIVNSKTFQFANPRASSPMENLQHMAAELKI